MKKGVVPKRAGSGAKSTSVAVPRWKTSWPRSEKVIDWMRCTLAKCDAIENHGIASEKARNPIETLAEHGHVALALRYVNRYLKRLPYDVDHVVHRVTMAELGAEICLNQDDPLGMEKYLDIAMEMDDPMYCRFRKDKGWVIRSIIDFKARAGILDPKEALDEDQRCCAEFQQAKRQWKAFVAQQDQQGARLALQQMEHASRIPDGFIRGLYLREVLDNAHQLGMADVVESCIGQLSPEQQDKYLTAEMLLLIGRVGDSLARAERDILQNLEKLSRSDDWNIHFPVHYVCRWLELLFKNGGEKKAAVLLRKCLDEMPRWPSVEQGWTTSSVYLSIAGVMTLIEGPQAANEYLDRALNDGATEMRKDRRRASINAALDFKANIGLLEESIAAARKMRSPTARRLQLGKLLVRCKRWKELKETLQEVTTPEEAAHLAWWLFLELRESNP